MSWTTTDAVKAHLFNLDNLPTEILDREIRFDASGLGTLPHRGLVASSEKVKRIELLDPTSQSGVQLNGEAWTQLNYQNLQPGTLVVAADETLSQVFVAGVDYAVDHPGGNLRRIEGGAISNGAAVQVYYHRYETLTKGVDYTIDYDAGELTVLPGGSLDADTAVVVDYTLSAESGADQLIPQAISEAEDKILARLKTEYDAQSQDQGLISGATELTVSIVCRALATRALSDGLTASEGRARGWRELAQIFEASAWRTLRPFLHAPAFVPADKKANQNWEWM